MDISLHNISPTYIPSQRQESSEIWKSELLIPAGSCYMIHAPSGSGKTTFVQILYGIQSAYEGSMKLGERKVADLSISEKAKMRQREISVVFQDLRLFPKSTGWENIQLNAQLAPIHSEAALKEMTAALGMADKLDRPVQTLSQGERQRIAIVRALAQPFKWLILDEPFSHLDEANIEKARELMLTACKEQDAGILLAGLGYEYGFPSERTLNL